MRLGGLLGGARLAVPRAPGAARTRIRWWWTSPLDNEEIAAEVNAIADAGFGGAKIAYSWGVFARVRVRH
jgi:hypothetical protein